MEKRFKVTKKTLLKNVVPETFEANEQWVKDNKRFANNFIIEEIKPEVIQEIEEPEKVEEYYAQIKTISLVNKKTKKEIVLNQKKQIENNEEIS